jgi:hypothetical protein
LLYAGFGNNLFRKAFGGTGILPVQVHRLKTCATNGGGHGGPRHHLFIIYSGANGACGMH